MATEPDEASSSNSGSESSGEESATGGADPAGECGDDLPEEEIPTGKPSSGVVKKRKPRLLLASSGGLSQGTFASIGEG